MMSAEKSVERRSRTSQLIEHIVEERQELLICLNKVAGLEPFKDEHPVRDLLQEFCEVLVDYVAAGHFELYEQIEAGTERRRQVVDVAEGLYAEFVESTESAIWFNDRFEPGFPAENLKDVAGELSALGEQLANRMELEDRLFATMLARH